MVKCASKGIMERARKWTEDFSLDVAIRNEIKQLIDAEDYDRLEESFSEDLKFGTAGIRAKVGPGISLLNKYTIRKIAQGLANYVNSKQGYAELPSISVSFDNRETSDIFARESAGVFSANSIVTHIFQCPMPTPLLSFAVRELKTSAGIMITASHNPPIYNGYKVYWSDGCQVSNPHDNQIKESIDEVSEFRNIKYMEYSQGVTLGLICEISEDVVNKYFENVEQLCFGNCVINKDINIIYTPLYGTGDAPLCQLFERRGFSSLKVVEGQRLTKISKEFNACLNPEDIESFNQALQLANNKDSIIIASDPDADRLGILVNHKGEWVKLTGNQIGVLLLDYYLANLKRNDAIPKKGHFVSSFVSTPLASKIANYYNLTINETPVGFKHIGHLANAVEMEEEGSFIFGMEESGGYLLCNFVRDKDAIIGAIIFSELSAELKGRNLTAVDRLNELYRIYGYHNDFTISFLFKSNKELAAVKDKIDTLRTNPPKVIGNSTLAILKDFKNDSVINVPNHCCPIVSNKRQLPVT